MSSYQRYIWHQVQLLNLDIEVIFSHRCLLLVVNSVHYSVWGHKNNFMTRDTVFYDFLIRFRVWGDRCKSEGLMPTLTCGGGSLGGRWVGVWVGDGWVEAYVKKGWEISGRRMELILGLSLDWNLCLKFVRVWVGV